MKINQIFFLGFCVSQEYFDKYTKNDKNPQIAAYKFESRLIHGLRTMNIDVINIASLASSPFPKNNKIFFPSEKRKDSVTISTLNLPGFKLMHRFMQTLLCLYKWIKQTTVQRVICIYSAHTPYLLAAYLMRIIFKISFFVVIPDIPIHMRLYGKQNMLIRLLKKIDSMCIDWLLKRSAGISVFSKNMVLDKLAWQKLPYIVIEGICEEAKLELSHIKKGNYFLYAGGLNELYGVKMLIDSFIKSRLDAELWLCGRGDLEPYIEKISKKDLRIKYLGFLEPSVVAELQAGSKAMIITRDPNELYTRYTFPSKIIEYLAAGIPVLSTRLAGIPEQYFEYLISIEEYTSECLIKNLEKILLLEEEMLNKKVLYGQEYVFREKSPSAVGKNFLRFMEESLSFDA